MALKEAFSTFTYTFSSNGRSELYASTTVVQCLIIAVAVFAFGLLYALVGRNALYSGFPLVRANEDSKYTYAEAQAEWNLDGHRLIEKGLKQFKGFFQVVTAIGPRIIVPNKYVDEIRNDPHLSFTDAVNKEFFGDYPGFEAFRILKERDIFQEAIRIRLTQSLNFVTEELASEAHEVCSEAIGESEEWKEVRIKQIVMDLVARVSQRVFIGPDACRNDEWLTITKRYTVDSLNAARELRKWSPLLRPWVHWFLPSCRRVRAESAAACRIVHPIVAARRERNRQARERGEKGVAKVADAVGWLDESARGRPFDIAYGQLAFAVAATFTTTELTTICMLNLCAYPEYVQPLREEIVEVLGETGWKKAALQKLRLMDSFVKESQRLQHEVRATITRRAKQNITLSDGTVIPKDAMLFVSTDTAMDPSVFPDPHVFNGHRFLEMRARPGQENRWQLATTSAEHLGFGHGQHACPGRFFAANEIKVLLIFMLMKYDWRLPEGQSPAPDIRRFAHEKFVNPEAKLMVRRREEEIEI